MTMVLISTPNKMAFITSETTTIPKLDFRNSRASKHIAHTPKGTQYPKGPRQILGYFQYTQHVNISVLQCTINETMRLNMQTTTSIWAPLDLRHKQQLNVWLCFIKNVTSICKATWLLMRLSRSQDVIRQCHPQTALLAMSWQHACWQTVNRHKNSPSQIMCCELWPLPPLIPDASNQLGLLEHWFALQ